MSAVSGGRSGKSFLSVLKNVANAGGRLGDAAKLPGEPTGFNVSGGDDLMKTMQRMLGKMGIAAGGKGMDPEQLDALSLFLVDLGFDKGEVSSLMKKLSLSADQGEIPLTELFSGLGELGELPVAEEDEEEMMAVSALPFLQSILEDYGLTADQVEGALSKATEKSGVSIPKLVSALKEVQEQSHPMDQASAGIGASDKGPDFDKQLSGLMERIGINGEKKDGGPLTFDEFLTELGNMVQESPETGISGARAINELEKVIAGFSGARATNELENIMAGFSGAEATNELENIMAGLSAGKAEEPSAGMAQSLKGVERKGTDLKDKAKRKENPAGLKAAEPAGKKADSIEELLSGEQLEAGKRIKGAGEGKVQAGGVPENSETSPRAPGDGAVAFAEGTSAEAKIDEVVSRPPAEKRGLPAYVMNQVSRQLVRSSAEGESELQIQIKPPRLGRLQMTIDNSSDGLKVSIIAEHQAARDMLLAHSSELKATLAEQGMRVDSIDVALSRNFDQTLADTRRDQSSEKRKGGKGDGSTGDIEGSELMTGGIQRATRLDRGDLDLVA